MKSQFNHRETGVEPKAPEETFHCLDKHSRAAGDPSGSDVVCEGRICWTWRYESDSRNGIYEILSLYATLSFVGMVIIYL